MSSSTVQEVVFLAGCHHIVLVCLTSRGPGRLDVSIDCDLRFDLRWTVLFVGHHIILRVELL